MRNQARPRWVRWPRRIADPDGAGPLAYGADYNPEQWPRETWKDDVRLMRTAGVNIVSLGIFSWARLQPTEETWDFGWLDAVMDLLHDHDIAVDLATATASPPPWLTTKHPEVLPMTAAGVTLWPGARQHWRPTSPVFRRYALALTEAMARRYADHPALAAWHLSNELGCHNVHDYSDDAAAAFRDWLRARYGTVEALNHAWGTAFWSQHYGTWGEILPPRLAAADPNPTQQLDFKRFSSDALKDYLRAERDVLHRLTPDVPVTTNFMVMDGDKGLDYADWAAEVDFVSNDHYVVPGDRALDELSYSANLTSGIAGGDRWFLMEHSTSAVNWRSTNLAKPDGALVRDSLTHVAHGADAVCFFQWRQSAAGAEKYHSAMVPHAGEDSEVFRTVTRLGQHLQQLAPVSGTHRLPARAAVLFDIDSWWAAEQDSHPNASLDYRAENLDWYTAFLDLGVRVDVLPTSRSFDAYDVVVAPVLHLVPTTMRDRLARFVEGGGHLVTTYFSGIVDEHDHVWLGGYPGALRDLLGVRIEEFAPLPDGEQVELDDGGSGTLWTDRITVTSEDTQVLAAYRSGPQAGLPAITRRALERGSATYVSTRLGTAGIAPVLAAVLQEAGVASELPASLRGRVELVVRVDEESEYWFVINRTDDPVDLGSLSAGAEALLRTPSSAPGSGSLPGRGVAVFARGRRGA